jgi:hypothetical protein
VPLVPGTGGITLAGGGSFGDWIYGSGADGAFTVNQARTVTDGMLIQNFIGGTFGVSLSSATANFTAADIGQGVACLTSGTWPAPPIPHFVITSIVSSTQVVLNTYKGQWVNYVFPPVGPLNVRIGGLILAGQFTTLTIPTGVTARLSPYTYDVAVTGTQFNLEVIQGEVLPILYFFQCTEAFVINGTLDLSGANASGITGGISADQCGGGFGSDGQVGLGLQANADAVPGNTTNGPCGGPGGAGAGAFTGGGPSPPFYAYLWSNPLLMNQSIGLLVTSVLQNLGSEIGDPNAGGGGSGTGDGSSNPGGGSGEGGVGAIILARHIVHGPLNVYNLQGGNGANGTAVDCGGGGGGGQAWWTTFSDDVTGTAVIVGTSGQGGLSGGGVGMNGTKGDSSPGGVHFLNRQIT